MTYGGPRAAPRWPTRPLFYVCVPSLSDDAVAPPGDENLFVLVPLAAGLQDSDEMREACCAAVLDRLERHTVTRYPPRPAVLPGRLPSPAPSSLALPAVT